MSRTLEQTGEYFSRDENQIFTAAAQSGSRLPIVILFFFIICQCFSAERFFDTLPTDAYRLTFDSTKSFFSLRSFGASVK